MSWLARLKTGKAPEKDASKTTETLFVVSVAPSLAPLQKNDCAPVAANDPAPAAAPIGTAIDIGTIRPPGLTPKCLAASLALDAAIVAAGLFHGHDPDADCWPHSTAMNDAEIDQFAARLHRFTEKGMTVADGEALADRLVIRDREEDDRRLCLECQHLSGYSPKGWRCGNWQAAGVARRANDAQLPVDFAMQLQRCDGFGPHAASL